MEPSVGVGVLEQAVFVLVVHSHLLVFFFLRAHEIIGIDEVVAGVVRRVDVDHLYLAEIALLQELEDFQIVALDVEIFGGVPVLAFLHTGAQRLANGLVGFHNRRLLAHPGKLVALVAVHHVRREHLLQQLKVDCPLDPAVSVRRLGNAVREQGCNTVYVLRRHVRRFKFHLVHLVLLLVGFL